MKRPILLFATLALLALGGSIAKSATITWTNLAGGNWNDTNNWDLHQIPGPADTAVLNINLAGSLTVPTNNVLNWMGGSVTGGLVTVSSNSVINWSGGDLSGGALTVAQGGTLAISNSVTFGFNGGNYTAVPNGGFLTNNGTVLWAASGVYGYGSSVIQNSGLWQSVTDGTMSSQHGTNAFTSSGALQKTGGTGSTTITWNVISTGSIDTPTGSLALNFTGASTLHGTANLAGGSINGSLALASNAVANWSSGAIGGAVNISSNAVMDWAGGDMSGGSLTVAPGGTLTVSNTVTFGFNGGNYNAVPNGGSLTNNGTVIWAANNGYGYGGGTTIYNAGLWQFTTDGTLSVQFGTNTFANAGALQKTGGTGTSTIAWNFASTGTINTTAGLFALHWTGPSTLQGNFTVSGIIAAPLTITSGATMNWAGGDLSGGSLTVASGGTLTVSNTVSLGFNGGNYNAVPNGGFLTNNGTVIWAAANGYGYGGGTTIYNAGLWQSTADGLISSQFGTNNFINTGTLQKTGGNGQSSIDWAFQNNGGILDTTNGSFNFGNWNGNGAINGNATLTGTINGIVASNAVMHWAGGDLSGRAVTVAPGGTLTVSNTVTFGFAAGNYNAVPNGGFLTNNGTVIWTANNTYGYGGGSTIYNAGLWQLTNDCSFSIQFGTNVFINTGTLQKTGGINTSMIGWAFSSSGTMDLQAGTLSLPNLFVQTGGVTLLQGGDLQVPAGFALQGGMLAGTNTVFGNVTNGGVVAPGLSPGRLTINGSYVQMTNGTLAIELAGTNAGTNFDLLVVTGSPGTANLAGTLQVVLTNGFYPATNAAFTFLNAGSVTGSFNPFSYPSNDVGMSVAYAAASSTVLVINVHPVLPVLGGQTVNEQTLLTVNAAATDADRPSQTLTYSLTNSPPGATVDPGTGVISWTPAEDQGPATTNITVIVTDNGTPNLAVSATFQVTVNEVNVAPVLTGPSDQIINEQTSLNIFATATDADIPANPLTFALVSGPMGLNVATNGNITWTPTEAQGPGVYTVFVKVSDSSPAAVNATSLSATNSFQITVNEVNVAPVLGALSNFTVNPGQTVSFTATATDADLPTNTLTFSLVSPPAGAAITGGGSFNWRPPVSFANSTNAVQVRVTDNGSPNLSDTKSFNVVVNPLAPVILTPLGYSNGQFNVQVSGTVGPDYVIVGSSNLVQWGDLFTNLSPATPFVFTNTNNSPFTNRFFRVRLRP